MQKKISIPNVKKIITISSGKGGVGKSTIALHIALSLQRLGYKTALVDADIYGSSIPKLLNIQNQYPEIQDNKMLPIKKFDIHTISMGYITNQKQALIWRGPMLTKALQNLMFGTKWPETDYMIIDTPPGTGDIHLTLAEKFHINGAILVSTPQILSLDNTLKSYDMYLKFSIPILGIIENMSYLLEKNSDIKIHIFGHNEVQNFANNLKIKFLGEIPIDPQIGTESILSSQKYYLNEIFNNISLNIL